MTQSLSAGKNPPEEFNVLIEITAKSAPVKYEFDKKSSLLFVDRFMTTSMFYPCDYGYIPSTLADDGDPMDVLVISPEQLINGCVVPCRAIGALNMSDEGGGDIKIIAAPTKKICPELSNIEDINDLPKIKLEQIKHFFEHYKDLETEKWVKIDQWKDRSFACEAIQKAVKQYQN